MKDKKYFCYEIYKNLAIWSANGKLSYNPCSYYSGYIKTSDKFNLGEVWNSPEHNQLKQMIDKDQPIPGCSRCYTEEEHGLVSRRMGSKELYENYFQDTNINLDGPQGIDYSVGNLCNLKCMICGPGNSSAWVSDYQTIYPTKNIDFFKHDKYKQLQVDDSELLKNIKNLHIHGGGEPLLSQNHIELLKKIKSVKGLSDVYVFYNINGTKRASKEVLDIWSECQLVELYFSIDDIGQRFNYQRTGAEWDELVANLNWYKENMPVNHMFKINCTWGYLNLFYLDELVDWHNNNFNTNRLGDPVKLIFQKAIDSDFKLSLDTVSSSLKTILIEKFKNYPRLLELVYTLKEDDTETHNEFWKSVGKIDAARDVKFQDICPELSSLLS
jgi:Radical SAM superfamily/4Fe-4S single cluster domain